MASTSVRVCLLALRERARSAWRRLFVRFGWSCLHTLDPKAWRPALQTVCEKTSPSRMCRYCDAIETISREECYARFGIWMSYR
jgi:hypothetical protein